MKDVELKAARDRDIFHAYRQAVLQMDFTNQEEAIDYVRMHTAPRFYISPKVCSILLGKLFAGKPLDKLNFLALKRLYELKKRYMECKRECGNLSRERICEIIVDMPAPEFYVGRTHASRIISKEMRRHNEELIKNLAK